MGTGIRIRLVGAIAAAGALVLSGGPAMAAASRTQAPQAYTCRGGAIGSGSYASLTVRGACSVRPGAVIRVAGNVMVGRGATLDAQSAPSRITVGGSVIGAPGSLIGLGCQPNYPDKSGHPCTVRPKQHSTITVCGGVRTNKANTVLLNGITVRGNVTLLGGGGPIPWSIKNDTIGRNLTVSGQTTDWLGVLFNTVGGSVTLIDIAVTDTDPGSPGAYVVRNTIRRNLVCAGITPGVSGGFIPGEVNVVGGLALGQCASLV